VRLIPVLLLIGPAALAQFTATVVTTYTDDDGGTTQFREDFYRSKNGSYVRSEETEAYDGERGIRRTVVDVSSRSMTTIDSFTHSIEIRANLDETDFRKFPEPFGSCGLLSDGTWKPIRVSGMLGFKVIEVEQPMSANAGARLWVAPELGCFPLLDLYMEKGETRTKREVVSVTPGDPDPVVFQVPSGYIEVGPLQFETLWKKRFHGRSYAGDRDAAKAELAYQAAKARSSRRE